MSPEPSIEGVRRMLSAMLPDPDMPFMARRHLSEQFAQAFALPDGVAVKPDILGGVPVEWIVPHHTLGATVLFHLHGGGYVLGNPAASRPFTTALALKSGARIVSVDYRLAPEHPFPAAVDDAVAAYRALLDAGTDANRIAIGGESAGGGLAVAMLLALRSRGIDLPAAAFAVSPWSDMTCSAESFDTCAVKDPMLTRRALKEMGEAYLAGADERHPLASPVHGDLAGLPPLLIQVGSDEVLLDDAHALHVAAAAAGVPATIEEWEGMIHVWHMFHPVLPDADKAIDGIAAFVKSHWTR